ncbi:hypothetical protein [Prosthecomicrobium hirschii]|uniref:hypothetical protein n=1 Tax=Prosthecodimorpha hirschii TaxID=665126 RepID=UPI001129850F|nr:hypothetical protein [Prosthecomicrobium hirschii]MCW1843472.1 hypothetical protein [Prosthecomicrobium hirschii]TPQ45233.1 hypothetical protein C2U72_26970 [Prosthecomicrobium hirschii]
MTHPILDDDDKDPPLDPAQLRLQAKFRKLLAVGYATLALGIVAVFAAVLYRSTYKTAAPPSTAFERPLDATLPLPEGARVTGTALDGDRLAVTLETPTGAAILVVDLATLKPIRRLDLPRPR